MERLSTRIRRLASADDGSKAGDSTSVGLFIPLPAGLAKQFPKKKEDKSPPHVTFLYVGHVPPERHAEFLEVCRRCLGKFGPVHANLSKLSEFVNQHGQTIPHIEIGFGRDMAALRRELRRELMDAGFKVSDKFLGYKPHSTLDYLDDSTEPYDGPVPEGSFTVDAIEVWGLPSVKKIRLATMDNPVGAATCIVRDGQVLLLRRSVDSGWMPGSWNFPGGGVEEGETPLCGALREAVEEASILPRVQAYMGSGQTSKKLMHIFLARDYRGTVRLNHEHDAYAWVSLDMLRYYSLVPYQTRFADMALRFTS